MQEQDFMPLLLPVISKLFVYYYAYSNNRFDSLIKNSPIASGGGSNSYILSGSMNDRDVF